MTDAIKAGELGTPEQQTRFNAFGQMADVAAKAGNGLKCVVTLAAGKFLFQEANLAAALGCKRTVTFEIRDTNDVVQGWYNGAGTIAPTETCTDAQIGIPVVTGGNTIQFTDGVAEVEFALDTDAGATKTYVNADLVTLTMAIPNVFGVAVTVTNAVHVFTAEQTPLLYAAPKLGAPLAAQANSAGAGSFQRQVVLSLKDSLGNVLTWLDGTVTLTPTETCNDAQIGIPVVVGGNSVAIVDGVGTYTFAYSTDSDVTKHYVAGDLVTITPAMADVGGVPVTITQGIVVDTFV